MISPSEFEPFDRNNVLIDEDTWEALFHQIFSANPEAVLPVAIILYDLLDALRRENPDANAPIINTLKGGIVWLYRYSPVANAAFVAFLHYLAGTLPDADSLNRLLLDSAARSHARKRKPSLRKPQTRKRATPKSKSRNRAGSRAAY